MPSATGKRKNEQHPMQPRKKLQVRKKRQQGDGTFEPRTRRANDGATQREGSAPRSQEMASGSSQPMSNKWARRPYFSQPQTRVRHKSTPPFRPSTQGSPPVQLATQATPPPQPTT